MGQARDPLIGRDVLLGSLIGIGMTLLQQLAILVRSWVQDPRTLPLLPMTGEELGLLFGPRYTLGILADALIAAVCMGLFFLLLMLLLRILLRRSWLANVFFIVIATGGFSLASGSATGFPWITHAVISAGLALVLARIGLLSAIVGLWVSYMLRNSPLTTDIYAWYASAAGVILFILVLIWGYALRQTLKRGWTA